jgi:poly-beta-1,6-N-acetyl-D-glucosamine synthase
MLSYFLLFYGLSLSFVGIGFYFNERKIRFAKRASHQVQTAQITVVIPFRNEAENLPDLLKCIQNQKKQPAKWLLINDHSEDDSLSLVQKCATVQNLEVQSLPKGFIGKKTALNYAIQQVNTTWVLTLDADVVFDEKFILNMETVKGSKLFVLPVRMKAQKINHLIYEMDVLMVNALNAACAGFFRPIVASGANLLFEKEAYLHFHQLEKHKHIASGDDAFFLRDMLRAKQDVSVVNNALLTVETKTPTTWNSYVNQRVRWISKSTQTGDGLSQFLGIFQVLLQIGFFGLIGLKISQSAWFTLLNFLIIKTFIDLFSFMPYFFRLGAKRAFFFLPVYQFLYPIWNIIILFYWCFRKVEWKNRPLVYRTK